MEKKKRIVSRRTVAKREELLARLVKELDKKESLLEKAKEEVARVRERLGRLMYVGDSVPYGNRAFTKKERQTAQLPPKEDIIANIGEETYIEISNPSVELIRKKLGSMWIDEHCTIITKEVLTWEKRGAKKNGKNTQKA